MKKQSKKEQIRSAKCTVKTKSKKTSQITQGRVRKEDGQVICNAMRRHGNKNDRNVNRNRNRNRIGNYNLKRNRNCNHNRSCTRNRVLNYSRDSNRNRNRNCDRDLNHNHLGMRRQYYIGKLLNDTLIYLSLIHI